MINSTTVINGNEIPCTYCTAVVVGTGAAGLNAADTLWALGVKDIVVISNGLYAGTSRNTGSDKQTYYKMSQSGTEQDSVTLMAEHLFKGGGMHGDHALIEASLSCRNFYKLVNLGVPFPHDKYGQYVGYRTDHDSSLRATSAGPLTSKYMTEVLYESVKMKGITMLDNMQLISILTDNDEAYGIVALSERGYEIIFSPNIVLATGGPADMYRDSVYPPSQIGATGVAFRAGCKGANLTEWQYGIASVKFRWNLSGTFQQVIPRYVSTDLSGKDEKDFIFESFSTKSKALNAIFLKGYQWPFDAKKLNDEGSSTIDYLIYEEIYKKNRRVWIDYTQNACDNWFDLLFDEGKNYLLNCKINKNDIIARPVDRLKKINPQAYDLYKNHDIDLENEMPEIALCAQHNNGGLQVDINWQSNIKGIFAIGEAAGIYGVYRPGGTALNSTQTGGVRCAEYIKSKRNIVDVESYISKVKDKLYTSVLDIINTGCNFLNKTDSQVTAEDIHSKLRRRMSEKAGAIRAYDILKEALNEAYCDYDTLLKLSHGKEEDLREFYYCLDNLVCQINYISAMIYYIESGGTSRGSYLIVDCAKTAKTYMDKQLVTVYKEDRTENYWEDVRPIPEYNIWFENIWRDYREGNLFD